jgi:predicted RNA-binding Zn ribbon-like protein
MRGMDLPPPAPGEENYRALALANTRMTVAGDQVDRLRDPATGTAWLVEQGLAPVDGRLGEPCAVRLRDFRDCARNLLTAFAAGSEPEPEDLAALNDALTGTPAVSLLVWDKAGGPRRVESLSADHLVDTAIARLAADTADLLTSADASVLAACGAPGCIRFYLRTHASRQWCSTRCGDRVRAARHYARRTGAAEPAREGSRA